MVAGRAMMNMRALVERATTVTDDSGNPGPPTWATLHRSLPCRAWVVREREVIDSNKTAALASHRIIIPKGTDIRENDRITVIEDRAGTSLVGNTMQITARMERLDHIQLLVREEA